MKQFELSSVTIDPKDFLRRSALETDTTEVFSEPGVYLLNGKPAIIYGRLDGKYEKMLWALKSLGLSQETRSAKGGHIRSLSKDRSKGLGESRIIGFRPRVPFGANFCSVASSVLEYPSQSKIIFEFAQLLNNIYGAYAPEVAAKHSEQLGAISADWIIPGTRFTSGIVNRNNPLKYHFDRGNFEGVMSAMVVFRQLTEGGYLSIPRFGARWLLEDHTFFLFDGQSHLHGVTPIKKVNKHGYRYSVVFYALRAMGKCGTLEEELQRARVEKRGRERRRI